jgi:hypothetical protein
VDHGLAGAGDLRGDLADRVDAEEHAGTAVEEQFEQAFLAGDDPAWCGAELASPGLKRDSLSGAVFLAFPRAGHFGEPVYRRCRDLVDVRGNPQLATAENLSQFLEIYC